jgi:hypothetical protein
MRNLVNIFEELFREHDGFQRNAHDFSRAMKTEEFKFLVDAILMLRGEMARDMFSYSYTKSDPIEKDVTQRTYYNVNQILDFLINPTLWVQKKSKLKQAYTNLASKVKPNRKEGKK